ncbi:potassium channel family protein [Leifsonia sp. AG29]|uniref:potassium channel family protein n=1 Tax=Leifsonia sp. AG29 TaxID=2598860 RepID=UPI00131E73DA|nr:potassium channel family protein [Leifsonia sp. AG29]
MTQARWRQFTEWPLLGVAVIFLVAYSIEVIGDVSDRRAGALDALIWVTWFLFAIDYLVMLVLAENRGRWFVRNLHELAILALPVLRPLRLIRLVLVLTILHRFAGSTLRGRVLTYVLGSAVLLTYVGAIAVLDAEENAPGSNIKNVGDALWWAAVTITTVGYGDHYPVTAIGRLVAVGLMVGGIAVLGVVTASVASWLIEQVRTTTAKEIEQADADLEERITELTALLNERFPSSPLNSGNSAAVRTTVDS